MVSAPRQSCLRPGRAAPPHRSSPACPGCWVAGGASATRTGPHGALRWRGGDRLSLSDTVLFEMEEIMARPRAAAPALLHLFDRLEERFDGEPTLLVLDEAWLFLDSPLFAARIRDWLKGTAQNHRRHRSGQSLADVADSAIAPALIKAARRASTFLTSARSSPSSAKPMNASGSTKPTTSLG